MATKPYGMICPITKACVLLEPRWTIPILVELGTGSTRFNDLRRGIGSISPALLSKRLKEMEAAGLIERIEDPSTGAIDYIRTQMAVDLDPAFDVMFDWAQRYVEAEIACDMNVSTLMWKLRKSILIEHLPQRRIVMRLHFENEKPEYSTYWAVISPGSPVEICTDVPGFDVDLYIETSVKSLTAIMLARSTIEREIDADRLFLSGDALLARTMQRWLRKLEPSSEDQPLPFGVESAPERPAQFG